MATHCVFGAVGFLNTISVNFMVRNSYQKDEIGLGGMGWIHLAQDRDKWQALVNTAMNLRVP
jgi:hypothetical protein